jgi:hypothetical protein
MVTPPLTQLRSMNGIGFAPVSFNTFYDTLDTNALPFNDRPDASSNSEASCFLAPPVKTNTTVTEPHAPTVAKIATQKLSLFAKALQGQEKEEEEKPAVLSYVDFKAALLPSMLNCINDLANNDFGVLEEEAANDDMSIASDASRQQLLKTALTLLPGESQWYQLNQLRIHAGGPERSDEGAEQLLRWAFCIEL